MVGIIHGNELRKTEATEGQALGKPLLTIQGHVWMECYWDMLL